MFDDCFAIEVDHDRRLLRATLRGQWQLSTVDRYRDVVRKAAQAMVARYPISEAAILIDTRSLPVQSREVVDHYSQAPIYNGGQPRRIALLVASRLVGMQVRRIGTGAQHIYEDEGEALAFLFAA